MMSKEDFMNFNWMGAKSIKSVSQADVSITKRKVGYGIIFRNKTYEVFKNTRVEFAFVNDDTIAFRGSSRGYSLNTKSEDSLTRELSVKVPEEKKVLMDSFVGDYTLQHEKTFDLYYVTKNK